jgi:hypothetical protein
MLRSASAFVVLLGVLVTWTRPATSPAPVPEGPDYRSPVAPLGLFGDADAPPLTEVQLYLGDDFLPWPLREAPDSDAARLHGVSREYLEQRGFFPHATPYFVDFMIAHESLLSLPDNAPLSERHLLATEKANARAAIRRLLEARLFDATFALRPEDLSDLANNVERALGWTTNEGLAHWWRYERRDVERMLLPVPNMYLMDTLTISMHIVQVPFPPRATLYAHYENRVIPLAESRVVTGGWNFDYDEGQDRPFATPGGRYFISRLIVLPSWHPPEWAGPVSLRSKRPGPENAYGCFMTELYRDSRPSTYAYEDDAATPYRVHTTSRLGGFTWGGSSHGCVRFPPDLAIRLFPFIMRYTPHGPMRHSSRGNTMPFDEGHVVYVTVSYPRYFEDVF